MFFLPALATALKFNFFLPSIIGYSASESSLEAFSKVFLFFIFKDISLREFNILISSIFASSLSRDRI